MRRTSIFVLGSTILLSAFLLFQVQPIISKFILPWFGGGPGVWTTCMVFFQVVLFAGYAYAHLLTKLPHRVQGLVHMVLVLLALLSLPIAPGDHWKPVDEHDPVATILKLLGTTVGLPYFVLASTSPLVQVWHLRQQAGTSPWRLYALSNFGSLLALLSYPFLVEPATTVVTQTWIWSAAFVVLAGLLVLHARRDRQLAVRMSDPSPAGVGAEAVLERPIRWWHRPLWLLLPALGSVMLLAATSHVCQDVAVIPFLWVVPLSLYLISFIITFDHDRWYVPWAWALPALVVLCVAAALPRLPETIFLQTELDFLPAAIRHWLPQSLTADLKPNYLHELGWAFCAMFLGVMVCHGELTRLKPSPQHLTRFYLMLSAGGALGGLCVSLVAPRVFDSYLEWPLALTAGACIAAVVLLRSLGRCCRPAWLGMLVALLAIALVALPGGWLVGRYAFEQDERIAKTRNFYGVISVEDDHASWSDGSYRTLYHGVIVHGMQYSGADASDEPASYYGYQTGVGIALNALANKADAKVGILGMGTATAVMYAQPGHTWRIYEINPEIVRFAHQYFTYLDDMQKRGARLEEVVGDGRLALEREPPQHFDVLLLDAFSGDSVPVHLLTCEALDIYARHMKPDGVIVFNITNRYLRLKPVLEKVAASRGWFTGHVSTNDDNDHYGTDYLLVTRNKTFLDTLPEPDPAVMMEPEIKVPLWTDQRHNLFQIMVRE